MNYTSPKNGVASGLKVYAVLNALAGIVLAIVWAIDDVNTMIISIELAAILVASMLIYALGEIVDLLHAIKINTARSAEPIPDELPDL